MEYELTTLRRSFLDEMARIAPRWVEIFNSSSLQRDLDIAVQNCDNEFIARHVRAWIDDVTTGGTTIHSLRDRIDEV